MLPITERNYPAISKDSLIIYEKSTATNFLPENFSFNCLMFTQQQAAGVRGQVLVPVINLIPNVFMIARDTVQTRIEISVLVQTCMVYRHRQSHVLIAVPVSTIIIIDNQPQILLPLTSPMASISTQSKTFKHRSRCL